MTGLKKEKDGTGGPIKREEHPHKKRTPETWSAKNSKDQRDFSGE
jgi:hypothetical protein